MGGAINCPSACLDSVAKEARHRELPSNRVVTQQMDKLSPLGALRALPLAPHRCRSGRTLSGKVSCIKLLNNTIEQIRYNINILTRYTMPWQSVKARAAPLQQLIEEVAADHS